MYYADNCIRGNSVQVPVESVDYTYEVKLLLKSFQETGQRFGLGKVLLYLKGSESKELSLINKGPCLRSWNTNKRILYYFIFIFNC